jgi:hypothetical protein
MGPNRTIGLSTMKAQSSIVSTENCPSIISAT